MNTRREFLKNVTYAAPVIVTLTARPAFAGCGSGGPGKSADRRQCEGKGENNVHSGGYVYGQDKKDKSSDNN